MQVFKLVVGLCSAIAAACSGGSTDASPAAAPAPPDMLAKLKAELTAAVIASEASCSAAWLQARAEPACAREPRRALEGQEHAWMLTNETIGSVGAAGVRDNSAELRGLHSRLVIERALRDATEADGLVKLAKSMGYTDALALLSVAYGFDIRATAAIAQQLLNASEGLYLVARTDVGVASADADALTAKALPAPKTAELAKTLVDVLQPLATAPAMSIITDTQASTADVFFVAPDTQRVIAMVTGGVTDVDAVARAHARARARRVLGQADASLPLTFGFVAQAPTGAAEWMAGATSLTEPALTRIVRVQAYRALENARADASRAVDMLALYDGVAQPLQASDPWMSSVVRFRARLVAAEVTALLVAKLGPTWWQRSEAAATLKDLVRDAPTTDALLAKLGRPLTSETLLLASARALARSDALVSRR